MRNLGSLLVAVALIALPTGCANCGGDDTTDASTREGGSGRRDTGIRRLPDGRVVADDGSVPPGGSTEPCGSAGQRCCRGDSCNLGLTCDPSDRTCRARPGGDCARSSDCASGLTCESSGGMMDCRVPDGGSCIGSSDCRDGRACIDGACAEPADACGADGGMCCMGATGMICRSGNVCVGTMCESCGGRGDPCCDGSTACGTTGSLLCIRDVCEMPTACGAAGMPCCDVGGGAPPECTRGARCNAAGTMCEAVPGAGEPGSECGADGQPCCPGDNCAFGSICEPFITNMCVGIGTIADILGIECGQEGQLCCFDTTGGFLPALTCEGDLECDFLFCSSTCGNELSSSCTTADDCCDTALCLPSPLTLRCCEGPGARCSGNLDCCGYMLCGSDNTCQCRAVGNACNEDGECCEGNICITGTCRPASECRPAQMACMDQSQCCRGLSCADTIQDDPMRTTARECCATQGTGCRNSFDCCGWMECVDDECACQAVGTNCLEDTDCCEGDICILGECADDTGTCNRIGESCMDGVAGTCCGSAVCARIGGATGPFQCAGRAGDPCDGNPECAGTMTCGTDGTCQCKMTGQDCIIGDCCGVSICNMPMPSMNGTCS